MVFHGYASMEIQSTNSDIPVEESSIRVLIDVDVIGNVINPSVENALAQFMECEDGYQSFAKTKNL